MTPRNKLVAYLRGVFKKRPNFYNTTAVYSNSVLRKVALTSSNFSKHYPICRFFLVVILEELDITACLCHEILTGKLNMQTSQLNSCCGFVR